MPNRHFIRREYSGNFKDERTDPPFLEGSTER
jgi:hypothetical protein